MYSCQPTGACPMYAGKIAKTSFLAIAALCLTTAASWAQKGFDFGLRANIQTSSLLNSSDQGAGPELDYKNNTGVAFGAGGGYTLNKHIGVGLDILYSKQGQGYKGVVSDISSSPVPDMSVTFRGLAGLNGITFNGTYTATRDVTYLKIPIMLRYTGNNMKKLYFSSFIGPQISLLSAADYKINGQTVNFSPLSLNAKDTYKKMTLDAVLGIGVAMNITDNIVASLHLRLDYGLGDAEDKTAKYTTTTGGTSTGNYYPSGRATTQNATGGGFISVSYRLVKKAKAPEKPKPAPQTPSQRR